MSTTAKPVVLLMGHDHEYAARLRDACEKEGNLVMETSTFNGMLRELHPPIDKNRRVAILMDPKGTETPNAVLSYVRSAVDHRALVFVLADGVDGDPDNKVRKWAMRQNHRAYNALEKSTLDLPGFAYFINVTPIWDDKKDKLIDPLTGLENAEGFVKNVKPELENMRDRRHRLGETSERRKAHMDYAAALIIDGNRIKKVNDILGHLKGDEAIIAIAKALRKHVRGAHHVCRKSGDEFLVWLPGYNVEQARRRGHILTSAIKDVKFEGLNGEAWELSAFFGAASIHAGEISGDIEDSLRGLINRADRELLKLKEKRNAEEGKLPGER